MPLAGLEPARCYPLDFESSASANSATAAQSDNGIILTYLKRICKLFVNGSEKLHRKGDGRRNGYSQKKGSVL